MYFFYLNIVFVYFKKILYKKNYINESFKEIRYEIFELKWLKIILNENIFKYDVNINKVM